MTAVRDTRYGGGGGGRVCGRMQRVPAGYQRGRIRGSAPVDGETSPAQLPRLFLPRHPSDWSVYRPRVISFRHDQRVKSSNGQLFSFSREYLREIFTSGRGIHVTVARRTRDRRRSRVTTTSSDLRSRRQDRLM